MESAQPLCPYFRACGGCSAQHIHYAAQVEQKKQRLLHYFLSRDIVYTGDISVFHGEPYGYRNRMDFVFCSEGLGLRRKGEYAKIIPIKNCVISDARINDLLQDVNTWYHEHKQELESFDLKKRIGTLKYAVVRVSRHTTSLSFILNSDSLQLHHHVELIRAFAPSARAENVIIGYARKEQDITTSSECFAVKGVLTLQESLCDTSFSYHSQSFFQNNTALAEKMVQYCSTLLSAYTPHTETFVDLYGGVGTFGFTLASLFAKTYIIDNESLNISCAQETIKKNKYERITATCGDAALFSKISFPSQPFLLVDPPRTGILRTVLHKIIALRPQVILYVSCNPEQMAREIKLLRAHYALRSLALFDLFPQTPHIEAIAELTLR